MLSSAAPILNENFNADTATGYISAPGQIGTSIFFLVAGTVDVVGTTPSSYYSALCNSGASGNCIDTEGATGGTPPISTLGQIQTAAIPLSPGTYVLSFNLTGWNCGCTGGGETASVNVTLGSLVNQAFNNISGPQPLVLIPFTVVGSQSPVLNFTTTSVSAGYAGLILDNVQINAVPEPGSVILVGLGLGLLAFSTKRLAKTTVQD